MKVKIIANNYLNIPVGTVVEVTPNSICGTGWNINAQVVLAHTTTQNDIEDDNFEYFIDNFAELV